MTAIAYKSGILAADSAIWAGGCIVGHQKKITRGDEMLLAAGGDPCAVDRFLAYGLNAWTTGGEFKVTTESFAGIIILSNGAVMHINQYGGSVKMIDAPFHAIGRCSDFLVGALAAGASAEEAVRLAIAWTDSAGGEVHVEKLGR